MAETLTFAQLVQETADDLGCHIKRDTTADSSQTTETNDTLTVATLTDLALDDIKYRHWYAALDSNLANFRMIGSSVINDGQIIMTRGFDANVNSGTPVDLFMVLSPEEWRLAINNGLRDKYLKARFTVPLVDGQTEYDLTAVASWLKTWEQVLRIRLRDELDGEMLPIEREMPVVYPIENYGVVKVQLPRIYSNMGSLFRKTMVVEARRYYDKLTSDSDTVQVVADRLIRAACKHEALKLIFASLGQAARQKFGQQMVLAERDLAEQEARWMNTTVKKDWVTEDERLTGDPRMVHTWSW